MALWKLPQPVEIEIGGLRLLFLDDFHKLFGSARAMKRAGPIHSYHSAGSRDIYLEEQKGKKRKKTQTNDLGG